MGEAGAAQPYAGDGYRDAYGASGESDESEANGREIGISNRLLFIFHLPG